jgi:hypothetical protein
MIIKDDAHAAENVMRPRLMSNPQHVHSRDSRRPRGSRLWLAVAAGLLLLGARSEADRDLVPPPALEVAVPDHALFADDFSTSELEQWRTEHQGFWSVRAGMLRADLPDRKHVHSLIHAGDSTWRDYVLEFDVCGVRGVDKGAVVRVTGDLGLGVDLRGTGYNDMHQPEDHPARPRRRGQRQRRLAPGTHGDHWPPLPGVGRQRSLGRSLRT